MLIAIAYFVCQSRLGDVHTDYYIVNKNMHMEKQIKGQKMDPNENSRKLHFGDLCGCSFDLLILYLF